MRQVAVQGSSQKTDSVIFEKSEMTESNNLDTETESNSASALGGVIRSLMRSLKTLNQIIRSVTIGSLPRGPLPLQTIGQAADQLNQLLEFKSIAKNIKLQIEEKNSFTKRISHWLHIFIKTLPEMIKSTILGTTLFSIYDTTSMAIFNKFKSSYESIPILSTTLTAFSAGTFGGIAHGTLYFLWDKTYNTINTYIKSHGASIFNFKFNINTCTSSLPLVAKASFPGLVLSHTLVHGVLFSTFECSKVMLSQNINNKYTQLSSYTTTTPTNHNQTSQEITLNKNSSSSSSLSMKPVIDIICVGVAGAAAGITAEVTGHYTEPLEKHGVTSEGWRLVRLLPRPGKSLLVTAMLPSALGFLAYELSKSNRKQLVRPKIVKMKKTVGLGLFFKLWMLLLLLGRKSIPVLA
eukprot:gene2122-4145_t